MKRAGCYVAVALCWLGSSVALGSPANDTLTVQQVAPGIFFHVGHQSEENSDNHGDIANIGFIVGSKCVAVVDTGGSPRIGRRLLATIRRHSEQPVCYVINTHMHPDHVFGNRAFARATAAETIAAAGFKVALAARAPAYLRHAVEELNQQPDASWVVMPAREIDAATRLDLGDRVLTLRPWPTAHTDNDLSVYDEKTRTLCAGDLLFVDRVPSIDGSLTGWLEVLDHLSARRDIARIVPGHGPLNVAWRQAVAHERDYFVALRDGARRAIQQGRTLDYAAQHVARARRDDWLLFDEYNARNVIAAYTELEWE